MKSIPDIFSVALIGCGAAGFVIASRPLLANKDADVPLNVLGINRSPYGEVFAMAMQGPIDSYFHAAEGSGDVCDGSGDCGHDGCAESEPPSSGMNTKARHFIEGMAAGLTERTNPRAANAAHKFYLRRGIEDKLRFAYNLDPGHYGNYNAYHFFLTEPQLGTRPGLTPMAAKLADETISYCLSRNDDPRLALTAAAASSNVIELMFNDRQLNPQNPRFSKGDMDRMLAVTDKAIASFASICEDWTDKGLWFNLSELRLMEIEARARFVLKVRESQGQGIALLSATPFEYGVNNPANKWRSARGKQTDPFSYGVIPKDELPEGRSEEREQSPAQPGGAGSPKNNTPSVSS